MKWKNGKEEIQFRFLISKAREPQSERTVSSSYGILYLAWDVD